MKPIKVILVDDHSLVRAGIRSLIQNISGVEVIAEANNGRDAIRLIDELVPDLVLLDIAMPELNGLEVISRISKDNTVTKIIILVTVLSFEILEITSSPFNSGIAISKSTRSGTNSSINLIASLPLFASAITSTPEIF